VEQHKSWTAPFPSVEFHFLLVALSAFGGPQIDTLELNSVPPPPAGLGFQISTDDGDQEEKNPYRFMAVMLCKFSNLSTLHLVLGPRFAGWTIEGASSGVSLSALPLNARDSSQTIRQSTLAGLTRLTRLRNLTTCVVLFRCFPRH
jgi:hypothetical protein